MIVRFRRGNMTETRPVHGKLDHHVSAARKRDGYKQLPVSVVFTKYGNALFRPVPSTGACSSQQAINGGIQFSFALSTPPPPPPQKEESKGRFTQLERDGFMKT